MSDVILDVIFLLDVLEVILDSDSSHFPRAGAEQESGMKSVTLHVSHVRHAMYKSMHV